MPSWEKLHRDMQGAPLRLLTVAVRDARADLRRLAARDGLSLSILLDEQGEAANRLGVRALPTAIFLDREGRVAGRFVGPRKWSKEVLLSLASDGGR